MTSYIEEAWKSLDNYIKEQEELKPKQKINHDMCKDCGGYLAQDYESGYVCIECGLVRDHTVLYEGAEWSNHEAGVDKSRCDTNSYSFESYAHAPSVPKSHPLYRYAISQYTSKEKALWKEQSKLINISSTFSISPSIINTATKLLNIILIDKKDLNIKNTRGNPRAGLVASCLYYAFIYNKTPRGKDDILKYCNITESDFLKGNALFSQYFYADKTYGFLLQKDIESEDLFGKFTHQLELPYKLQFEMVKLSKKYSDEFECHHSKTIAAGILVYIAKLHGHKINKTKFSKIAQVSLPTFNNIEKRLIKLEKE